MSFVKGCVAGGLVLGLLVVTGNRPSGAGAPSTAPSPTVVRLSKPQTEGGMPLMEALKKRRTSRAFAARPLPEPVLSSLLWAACGVNRDDDRRTAPSAVNWQEIDVYLAKADGLWLFDPKTHSLTLVVAQDLRAATGRQPFVKDAPVNLVYVADFAKMGKAEESDKAFTAAADTGFVSQNVYLFCASEGLATVVRGLVDRTALAKAMNLRDTQRIILAQSVGYPAE
jgi:SagB-type dehydrogenase family enzyme